MSSVEARILELISGLKGVPEGAYNIRENGSGAGRASTEEIQILPKSDKPGIDIHVAAGTKNQKVHIPVVITNAGLYDKVYNDFFIGEDAEVTIIAGCGIHNSGHDESRHDGIHTFYLGKGAKLKYVENHYAEGKGSKVLNPETIIYLGENASCEMDTSQISGVDDTARYTKCVVGPGAELVMTEKLMTHSEQQADSKVDVILEGKDSKCRVISRSVAKDDSFQVFYPRVEGNESCFGHVQCDAIIMGSARVRAIPEITANHVDAQLVHEAAIGRIAGDQILKLMTLGLTEEEAEEKILSGFLK